MKGWTKKTIGELCDEGGGEVKTGPFGAQLHQSDYQNEGIPVVMPTDIVAGKIDISRIARVSESHVDRLYKHKLSIGDIVYGRRGDIGRQALVRSENDGWLCGTGCLRISLGKPQVLPEFLHLYLSLPGIAGWVENQAVGATMPNLNTGILRRVPIWYPEGSDVQRKIASIVFAYDEVIENNKRRITLLEKMAEEIYREWFVRMRFPEYEKVKFVKGVPEGWEPKPCNEVLDVLSGGTPKTDISAYWDGHIPFFTPKDAVENFYVLNTEKYITENGLRTCNSRLYKKDTIFITARGTVGKLVLAHRDMAMNQSCYALLPKSDRAVYFYFLAIRTALSYIKGVSNSGVFDNIIVDTFKVVPILMPTDKLIKQFNELIRPLFQQTETLLQENEVLVGTRNRLLPRLISGKLSVENLDIQFPPGMVET